MSGGVSIVQADKPQPIAIVTGASRSRGIGAAICRALAAMQIDIFFTTWNTHDKMLYTTEENNAQQLLSELRALGVRAASMEADLSLPQTAPAIMNEVEKQLGPASILINNAAHDPLDIPFEQIDAQILDAYYAVNMRGTMLLSIEFARRFAQASGGRIINLTSGQGVGAMPGKLPYVATKGALEAFTVTLAAEVARKGITVNAVDPGPTDTGWLSADPILKKTLEEQAPFGRVGLPEDAARLIAFLASEASAWITGQIIHSRGGF